MTFAACECGCRCKCTVRNRFADAWTRKLDLARYVDQRAAENRRHRTGRSVSAIDCRLSAAFVPSGAIRKANDRNRQFLSRINASRRVLLTPTYLDGRFVIRICILSFRTHRDRIEECLRSHSRGGEFVDGCRQSVSVQNTHAYLTRTL